MAGGLLVHISYVFHKAALDALNIPPVNIPAQDKVPATLGTRFEEHHLHEPPTFLGQGLPSPAFDAPDFK
jgi:hypothetical protein